jgi:hypothetical protein
MIAGYRRVLRTTAADKEAGPMTPDSIPFRLPRRRD